MTIPTLLALTCAALMQSAPPQDRPTPDRTYRVELEDDQLRVLRVTLGPGEKTLPADGSDAVLIFLTATLDGRMPLTDAEWLPAGTRILENRAAARFEAIIVELKDGASRSAGTPPELSPWTMTDYGTMTDHVRVKRLIENSRLSVSKHRLASAIPTELPHFHTREAVIIYLTRGATGGTTGRVWARNVARGDVDLVPANTLHSFWNAASDPIDFISVFPK
jgi:quercetin dioxygenase-like cupin family protein